MAQGQLDERALADAGRGAKPIDPWGELGVDIRLAHASTTDGAGAFPCFVTGSARIWRCGSARRRPSRELAGHADLVADDCGPCTCRRRPGGTRLRCSTSRDAK